MITEQFLNLVSHRTSKMERVSSLVESMNKWFKIYEMDSKLRSCSFISQCAHETGGFVFTKEIGGKEYCSKYEPSTNIGKMLGNTEIGDGYKYKGRGPIQISGRKNYVLYGCAIDKNLVDNPDLLLDVDVGIHVACEYWKKNNLNVLADKGDIIAITKKINGGLNGLKEREHYYSILINGWNKF